MTQGFAVWIRRCAPPVYPPAESFNTERAFAMSNETVRFAPSDLTFLFDECKCCFYNKIVHGISRPRSPFPKVFSLMDSHQKEYFTHRSVHEVAPWLPPGRFAPGCYVASSPISVPRAPDIEP